MATRDSVNVAGIVGAALMISFATMVLAVIGSVMIAVSGGSDATVQIPGLVTAHGGSGADLGTMELELIGGIGWLIALTAVFALPILAVRRRRSSGTIDLDQ